MRSLALTLLAACVAVSACGGDDDNKNGGNGGAGGANGGAATGGARTGGASTGGASTGGASTGGAGTGGASAGGAGTGGARLDGASTDGSAGDAAATDAAAGDAAATDAAAGDAATDAAATSDGGPADSGSAPDGANASLGTGIYKGMTKIFSGTALDNWDQSPGNSWEIKDGAMSSKGAPRGYIVTKPDYGNARLIFSVRQVMGDHAPCILLFGIRPPPNNALGAIQFQPPNGGTWDYRPGKNNAGGTLFTRVARPGFNNKNWHQCEVLIKSTTGEASMACCPLTGTTPCKGIEVLRFKDPVLANKKGPIAWQIHNSGIFDQYKDVYLEENPAVMELITTK